MLQYIVSLSVLILAVILVRALFRKKVPPMIIYAMWLVVVVRMCIPTTLLSINVPDFIHEESAEVVADPDKNGETGAAESDLPHISVPDGSWNTTDGNDESDTTAPYIPPSQLIEPDTDGYQGALEDESSAIIPPQSGTVIDIPPAEAPVTDTPSEDAKEINMERIARCIWIAGSVVMAVISVVSSAIFTYKARNDRQLIHTVRGTKVYVSENVGTPCLAGLVPSIYLTPENAYSDACALTIFHEYTHLRHGDFIWSMVRQAALIAHWWNPLVWVAAVLSKQDAELACDASITKKLNSKKRLEYARIIVDTVPKRRGHAVGLGGGYIKERNLMITGVQKNRVIAIVLAVLICLGAVGCAFIGLKDEHQYSDGIYVRGANGADVIVLDPGICVMSADGDLSFADFTDGDKIKIEHGELAESYPMQTTVYSAEKLADGERADIPADIIETLTELGYIEKAENPADVTAEQFADAYAEAERIYAMFTGYGKVEYGTMDHGYEGAVYQEVANEGFTTLAEMEETVCSYFADTLADELLNTKVGENPLYIEHEGELYRFGGYAALWGYDVVAERSFETLPAEDGEYRTRVTATVTEGGLRCTAREEISYTVDEDGNVRFTEFTLMAESLFTLYQNGDGVREYAVVTFPDSEVGWFKVAQYGYNFYTVPNNGGHRIGAGNVDAVGYVVFGTKVTRWDEGFSEYITYRVEAKNGGIVSCEIVDNIIDLDFAAVGTPYGEIPDGVYSSMTTEGGQALWYRVAIEGDSIRINVGPDGSESGGQYYGTYAHDGASGKFTAGLMYDKYYTNDPDTEWGTIEARIYEYGDFVAVICDYGFGKRPMDMPIIYMKHEAIYGTERGVYFTSDLESFSPRESLGQKKRLKVSEFSYLISYYTSESLPCIYYGYGIEAERYAMVKTVFERPDFEYTSYDLTDIAVATDDDNNTVYRAYVEYFGATGEKWQVLYETYPTADGREPNDDASHTVLEWKAVKTHTMSQAITDIADWETLPWVSSAGRDGIHAQPIYDAIYSLVSGESPIDEFNALEITNYEIRIAADMGDGRVTVNLRFTVPKNVLSTVRPGIYSWYIECWGDRKAHIFGGGFPETDARTALKLGSSDVEKFADNSAVVAVDDWLTYEWFDWQIRDFGKWGEYSYLPVAYILMKYGENEYSIEYDKLVRLMAEKFGITDPEAMGLYEGEWDNSIESQIAMQESGCVYDKETGIVSFVAGTEMPARPIYRFLGVRESDGVTYVTVQLYADFNYLIPSYKVEYAIGEGDIFLGCEVVEGSRHKPNAIINYRTYTPPAIESATAYNTDDPTEFYPPESSHKIGTQSKIGDTYVRSYSVDDGLCVYIAKALDDGTFDMIKTEFKEPDFDYSYSSFRGYYAWVTARLRARSCSTRTVTEAVRMFSIPSISRRI